MRPRPHLATLVAEWESYGVPVHEQAAMAAWAFEPDPEPEVEPVALFENRRWIFTQIGEDRPRRSPIDLALLGERATLALAEFALLD